MNQEEMFKLNHLDHVAIRVADMAISRRWYENVLGMTAVQPEEWKPYPIFMLTGNFGVALFPISKENIGNKQPAAFIDHFAFNVSPADFELAKQHFTDLDIKFIFKNHIYFHSLYIHDPDRHTVELTTAIKEMKNDLK